MLFRKYFIEGWDQLDLNFLSFPNYYMTKSSVGKRDICKELHSSSPFSHCLMKEERNSKFRWPFKSEPNTN